MVFVSGGHTAALASRWLSREHNQDSSYSLTAGTAGEDARLTAAGTAAAAISVVIGGEARGVQH